MSADFGEPNLPTLSCEGEGEFKNRDQVDAERMPMFLEAQPAWQVSSTGIHPLISLRLVAATGPGDRPHIDTRGSAIELSVSAARELARWLSARLDELG